MPRAGAVLPSVNFITAMGFMAVRNVITTSYLKSADEYNAFVTRTLMAPTSPGRLSGLTFAVKDNIFTGGVRTTASSRILMDFVPDKDAFIVARIRSEGGTVEGKTNNHEFAIGATNTSSIFGPARNPLDTDRISGGSSGGSAVAVAAGMVDVGIGTDTGGSVRIPSAMCGVAGLKPTTGLIPSDGVIPLSTTLDSVGIIAREVSTIRRVFQAVVPGAALKSVRPAAKATRVGLMLFGDDSVSRLLLGNLERILSRLEVKTVSLPILEEKGRTARRIISAVESAAYHRKWLGSKADAYFPDVRKVLLSGLETRGVDYIGALQTMAHIQEEYEEAFSGVDVLLSPTVATVAPKISDVVGREFDYRDALLGRTELFNVSLAPSITINGGTIDDLPVGLMVSGRRFDDYSVLDFAERLQESLISYTAKVRRDSNLST